jgi:putative membrane protein
MSVVAEPQTLPADRLVRVRQAFLVIVCAVSMISIFNRDQTWVALLGLSSMIFIFMLGRAAEGWRNMVAFILITLVLSFVAEDIGVRTGAVFGAYHYSNQVGPLLDYVPLLVLVAYFAAGYASLAMGRLISGIADVPRGWRLVGLAAAGAMVMVGWDVAMDPLKSTIGGDWIWTRGGNYFGIPLQNFWGWFILNFVIYLTYLLFSAYVRTPRPTTEVTHRRFWYEPLVASSALALNIILLPVLGNTAELSFSPLNVIRPPTAIGVMQLLWTLSLIAVFTMLGPALFAAIRLGEKHPLPFTGDLMRQSARTIIREPAIWVIIVGVPAYIVAVYALGLT